MNLSAIQSALRERNIDAWLFYDHHHRDPIAYRVLGLPDLMVTRRWFYLIPAQGEPAETGAPHRSRHLDSLPGDKQRVLRDGRSCLTGIKDHARAHHKTIAMQYSPNNQIFYISLVDAGTVELVRSLGKEIVSSGDLVARFEATLTDDQIASHFEARDASRQHHRRSFQGNRAARPQWRHSRIRNAAVVHGSIRARKPGDRRSADRRA